MDLLNTIQDEVMKQKEEATQNNFERVADFRDFISGMQPEAGVTVTLKLCCISAERVNGGRGIRFTGIDASQRAEFEPTMNALADLTPLKKKPFIAQVTVWDAKGILRQGQPRLPPWCGVCFSQGRRCGLLCRDCEGHRSVRARGERQGL